MTPSAGRIVGIAAAIFVALAGLLVVQVVLLDRAVGQESAVFRERATAALAAIVEELEVREVLNRATDLSVRLGQDGSSGWAQLSVGGAQADERLTEEALIALPGFQSRVGFRGASLILQLAKPQRVRLYSSEDGYYVFLKPGRLEAALAPDSAYARRRRENRDVPLSETLLLDETKPAGRHELPLDLSPRPRLRQYRLQIEEQSYEVKAEGGAIREIMMRYPVDRLRLALLDKVLDQYLDFERRPIADRLRATGLDEVVRTTLRDHQITTPEVHAVVGEPARTFVGSAPERWGGSLRASEFRTRLFPHDRRAEAYDLVLYFPERTREALAGLALPAAAALAFLLLAAGCFAATLLTLARQREFASRLTDFIDNMAHAFKTPLSTLALVGTALGRDEVRADRDRLARYGRIVEEESGRLRRLAERILEMTVLERWDAALVRRRIDVHDVLERAVEQVRLEVERRGGAIDLTHGAADGTLEADEAHLRGAFDNLLDNALRYTHDRPEIHVSTRASSAALVIAVRDNGIGLEAADRRRVFDKYFRAKRGLEQETPGFGLGLSYVRWVAEAHGGAVAVASRPGDGSVFEMTLPRAVVRRGRRPFVWRRGR